MRCSQCQHENASDANFCDECGSPLARPCPDCGAENRPGARFCKQCGTSLTEPTPSFSPTQEVSPPIIQEVQSTRAESLPVEPRTPEAERRQLTVMFCDLVESTALSGQLDPEDLRDVVRAYQAACTEVIGRFEGYVAQLLGDGLLVYFGYPQAHEDDAQRAVRSGLGMLEAMRTLNMRLEREYGVCLAIRVGIDTGLVVVGEMGGDSRQEQLALGETPNVAARIQSIAGQDNVVISEATYRLVQGFFDCQELGVQSLRGVAESIAVYRVLRESAVQSRLEIASTRGLTPLVGREQEIGLLLERWEQTKDGQGQVVLLSGEAGIGKSRLVAALKDYVSDDPHIRWECRSSPYFTNSALYPVIDLMQQTLRWQQDERPETKLERLEQGLSQYRLPLDETVPFFAPLLSLAIPEDRYPPLNLSPPQRRQKTLEAILAVVMELSERQPVFFILEDLHWTDPTTLAFLDLLIDQTPTASLCALLTCRPEYQPTWSHRSYLTEVTVNRLSQPQIERMAQQVAGGKDLPTEILQQIIEKTDGVPLFVEELVKALLGSGHLTEIDDHYQLSSPLASVAIPTTLQDSLMARLDRLVTAKAVAQYASVIGRQFSYKLLHTVLQVDTETLQKELSRLVEAELVYQRGLPPQATYTFKHALIRDSAYESLLRSTRQHYHQQIAHVLEAQFPETAATQPELLAYHLTEAGFAEQAVDYWRKAGQQASEHSAYVEAVNHLTKGLEVLTTLPDTPVRTQRELETLMTLGPALIITKGYAAVEVEQTYRRARELCQQVGDTPYLSQVLWGLSRFYFVRGEYRTSLAFGEQLLTLAQQQQDTTLLLQAHRSIGVTLFTLGELLPALTHFEQLIALYDSRTHRSDLFRYGGADAGVSCLFTMSWILWMLGYPEQALQRMDEALRLAQEISHVFSLTFVLTRTAILYQCLREAQSAQEQAEAAIVLATEQEFSYLVSHGRMLQGWALAEQGQSEAGIAQMRQSLAAYRSAGSAVYEPYFLSLLAAGYAKTEQSEEGLNTLREALAVVEQTGERFYEADLYRLKGELLLQQARSDEQQAETCFHHALDIARRHQAKSWELRTATSLSRLWQSQDKYQDAYELLAPVYGWFTEGFDTVDLIEAKRLLDHLSAEKMPPTA